MTTKRKYQLVTSHAGPGGFTPERTRQLISVADSTFVSIVFTKKDGSERKLTFNPRDHRFIKGTGKPTEDPHIFRVLDVHKNEWRSFDCRRLKSMQVKGVIVYQ